MSLNRNLSEKASEDARTISDGYRNLIKSAYDLGKLKGAQNTYKRVGNDFVKQPEQMLMAEVVTDAGNKTEVLVTESSINSWRVHWRVKLNETIGSLLERIRILEDEKLSLIEDLSLLDDDRPTLL